MKTKQYACSIRAGRNVGFMRHKAIVVEATSKSLAVGRACDAALKQWPPQDGYRFHRVDVVLVPPLANAE